VNLLVQLSYFALSIGIPHVALTTLNSSSASWKELQKISNASFERTSTLKLSIALA
jgi:hypothetical protein